jgi:DNA-binding transcriptional regulator GbsR (MarR family)
MEESKKQFFEWTKQFWQARAQKTLSDEDVRQIIENMTGFFKILEEWKEKENDRTGCSDE